MKEDRLLEDVEIMNLPDAGETTYVENDKGEMIIDTPHYLDDALKAQDAKTARILNQQWVEEVEKLFMPTDGEVGEPRPKYYLRETSWQALKRRMTNG